MILVADTRQIHGADNSVQEYTLTARRGAAAVADTRFHAWNYPYNTTIARVVGGTLPASNISADGRATFRVRLRGHAGDRATIIVMASHCDDLVTEMISCVVD